LVKGIVPHLFLLFIFLGLSGLFAASEIALVNLTPSQVRRIVKQGTRHSRRLVFWERDPDKILITISIVTTLVNIAASATTVTIFVHVMPQISVDSAAVIATFVATLLLLIFGEITPKLLGKRHPVTVSIGVLPILLFLGKIVHPISKVVLKLSRSILSFLGKESQEIFPPESHREEIKALLELVKKEVVSERENKMLMSILRLEETKVRDIMVNRMNMVCLEINTPYEEVLEIVRNNGFSRIPVYEKNLENIKGILMAKDILSCWDEKSFQLASLMRPAKFTPEVITIDRALREFITTQTHLAIVVNEYGEVEGLVTLEDVIEEITGEIQDEFDTESILVKKVT
jgi:CBS domain containing-hemolysin-like protein